VTKVELYGHFANEELFGDLLVRKTISRELKYFALASRKHLIR